MFVSNDRKGYNNLVEAHSYFSEARNQFKLLPAPNQPVGHYLFLNTQYGKSIFVSKDESARDRIVEANVMGSSTKLQDIEPYIFVLHGIKGVMGSRNDNIYDFDNYQYETQSNWLFWTVFIIVISCAMFVVIKKMCFEQDNLSKFK